MSGATGNTTSAVVRAVSGHEMGRPPHGLRRPSVRVTCESAGRVSRPARLGRSGGSPTHVEKARRCGRRGGCQAWGGRPTATPRSRRRSPCRWPRGRKDGHRDAAAPAPHKEPVPPPQAERADDALAGVAVDVQARVGQMPAQLRLAVRRVGRGPGHRRRRRLPRRHRAAVGEALVRQGDGPPAVAPPRLREGAPRAAGCLATPPTCRS